LKLPVGACTLPDAARLLGLPLPRLRLWVLGRDAAEALGHRGTGKDRTLDFYTLIELFTIGSCGRRGSPGRHSEKHGRNSWRGSKRRTLSPWRADGHRLLKELGDETLLELGSGGQAAFEKVIAPFCRRLDFDETTKLASRFYPDGPESDVMIDPHHAFGRPVISGTNITTETLACLIRGGEKVAGLSNRT
jgi:hypothetical protein